MNKGYNGFVFTTENDTLPRKEKRTSAKTAAAPKGVSKAKSKQIGFTFTFNDEEPALNKKNISSSAPRSTEAKRKILKDAPKIKPGQKKFIFAFEVDKPEKERTAAPSVDSSTSVPVKPKPKRGKRPATKSSGVESHEAGPIVEATSEDALPAEKPLVNISAASSGGRKGRSSAAKGRAGKSRNTAAPVEISPLQSISSQDKDVLDLREKEPPVGMPENVSEKSASIGQPGTEHSPAEKRTVVGLNEMNITPSVIRSIDIDTAANMQNTPVHKSVLDTHKRALYTPHNMAINSEHSSKETVLSARTEPLSEGVHNLSEHSSGVIRKRMSICPGDFMSPVKIRRLSLDVFDKKKCSVFQTRRESLFGYDQIYGGGVSPDDFYRHSNASQPAKTRIKQILLWIAKYISNGHVKIDGLSEENTQKICTMYMRKINELVLLPEHKKPKEDSHIVENAKNMVVSLQEATARHSSEIQKWQEAYHAVRNSYTLSIPLLFSEENTRRMSLHRQSFNGLVSFDATFIDNTPSDIKRIISRNLEVMHSSLNSTRYFMFLSLEYAKKVSGSLLEASHPLDKPRTNALLHVLCRISRKS
ncbi:hypothetical protein NEPAR06_1288 [Nematocida parisii]|nr:hypothetical protein NEPAR06_1288 [Nematocida parisii]KAI5158391.1 hypothetical protein NEPAR05_1938 [Nematocida parisii]